MHEAARRRRLLPKTSIEEEIAQLRDLDLKELQVRWLARRGIALNGPLAEVVGFDGERPKPSYRSVTPLDARRLPTFN